MQHSQTNEIGNKGAMEIAEALKINNTLTILYLQVRHIEFATNQCE